MIVKKLMIYVICIWTQYMKGMIDMPSRRQTHQRGQAFGQFQIAM